MTRTNWPLSRAEALFSLDDDLGDLIDIDTRQFLSKYHIQSRQKLRELNPIEAIRLGIETEVYSTLAKYIEEKFGLIWPQSLAVLEYLTADSHFYESASDGLIAALKFRSRPSLTILLDYDPTQIRELASEISDEDYNHLHRWIIKYKDLRFIMGKWI